MKEKEIKQEHWILWAQAKQDYVEPVGIPGLATHVSIATPWAEPGERQFAVSLHKTGALNIFVNMGGESNCDWKTLLELNLNDEFTLQTLAKQGKEP